MSRPTRSPMTKCWPPGSRPSSRGWCATGRCRALHHRGGHGLSQFFLPGPPRRRLRSTARAQGPVRLQGGCHRLDFQSDRGLLNEYLDRVLGLLDDGNAPSIYIGSTDVDQYLPGFRAANDLVLNHPMFESNPPTVGVWIGNRTIALAHYDMSHNIACLAVGRRRFTLFPPEQVENLYPGPLDPTPGGQVVTMVDFAEPDFARSRTSRCAGGGPGGGAGAGRRAVLPRAVVAPGRGARTLQRHDQLLVEHDPAFMDTPQTTLLHALLSLRDRPEAEKRAWRAMFDYYVFGPAGQGSRAFAGSCPRQSRAHG